MLKLLLQAIASNSNIQSQVNRKKITCNVCAALEEVKVAKESKGAQDLDIAFSTFNKEIYFIWGEWCFYRP